MCSDNRAAVPGAPRQAGWHRSEPRRNLPRATLERIAAAVLPGRRLLEAVPLAEGLRNANFELRFDAPPWRAVLRVYEHDPSICQKEVDLLRLIGGSVPVAEVLHAEPAAGEGIPPFAVIRMVEGITFQQLKRSGDRDAIAQAARSAGETLAAVGRFRFPTPGWLGPGPAVTAPLLQGADPIPRFVQQCLASEKAASRAPADLRDRTVALVWVWAPQLAWVAGESCLVHGDFNRRNLLVRESAGQWRVAALLDWEFAVSSSPLNDLGSFLRYERAGRPLAEPHFSEGFAAGGGVLPPGWRRLARVVDLAALCESLTRDQLPDEIVAELIGLIRETVEEP